MSAAASPEYSAPLPKLEPPNHVEKTLDENLSPSPAPRLTSMPKASANYFPYHEALALRVGLAGTQLSRPKTNLGVDYMFPRFLSPHWELGADYGDASGGHVHGGMRWSYNQRSYFRPSLKLELDNRLDSSEGLAGLVSIDQYYLRGSAAIDYTFADPISLRLEASYLAGLKDSIYFATIGLNYAW